MFEIFYKDETAQLTKRDRESKMFPRSLKEIDQVTATSFNHLYGPDIMYFGRHGIKHNDTQHNDIQRNDTQHNETQNNSKLNTTLSIMLLCYFGECHLF
jgi:hypothetical protein